MRRCFVASLVAVLAWHAARGVPDSPKPGKLSKEEVASLQPGLALRLHADPKGDGPSDARRSRVAALHVPAGAAPSPFVPAGRFGARFSGYLKSPDRGAYVFRCDGTGTTTLLLNGVEVLRTNDDEGGPNPPGTANLVRGYNRIEIVYRSPERGPGTMRVSWQGDDFGVEPLPPEALFSSGEEADVVAGAALRDGRVAYATLGCARCHGLPTAVNAAACVMPEWQHKAPNLEGAGGRLSGAWLAAWIADPRGLRANATMPRVLHGEPAEVAQQAADLAAYLATLAAPAGEVPGTVAIGAGQTLYERQGCVGCHHLQAPMQEDAHGRMSLHYAAAKFQPGRLESFLRAPHQHFAWSRMPDFAFDADEAAALAAFLRAEARGVIEPPVVRGNAERGAGLFRETGCAHCHALTPDEMPPAAVRPAATAAEKGCLADRAEARGRAPDFGLDDVTRSALRRFLTTDGSSLTRDSPAEFAQRQVRILQCSACHRRDGATSRLSEIFAEEGDGIAPETLPSLTWAGEKLRPQWTTRLFRGERAERARPWLSIRMPVFPARAEWLAAGLAHEHGQTLDEDVRPVPDAALATIGRQLVAREGGFNCVACHGVGSQPAVAPFEAPGINLLLATQRLRYEYYRRWMIDPTRVDLNTRMPKFSAAGGTTPLKDVLAGDAHRQFEAIWHFMTTLPDRGNER